MKSALVDFKDGKRTIRRFVHSTDIKGFNKGAKRNFQTGKVYDVKWQKSICANDIYHDGYYPGTIVLFGGKSVQISHFP